MSRDIAKIHCPAPGVVIGVHAAVVSPERCGLMRRHGAKDGDHVLELELMEASGVTYLPLNVQEARALGRAIDDFLLTDVGYPRRT